MTGSRQVLLLSPHPDDIAWSLGGVVSRLREAGAEMAVMTFFGQSRYAPGSPLHGSLAATRLRAAEEDAWAALAGVTADRGELPDASLRGYDDVTEMGAEPEPQIVRAVAARLRDAVARLRPHLTLAPLAARGHVDHSAVRLALSSMRRSLASGLLWYEDLPYAEGNGRASSGDSVVIDVSSHWPAKEAGVRCFPSQLPQTMLPVLRRHAEAVDQARRPPGARHLCPGLAERLWTSTPEARTRLRFLVGGDSGEMQASGKGAGNGAQRGA
jgi:LmbE family N-acetylglucosaminyl deacetylase